MTTISKREVGLSVLFDFMEERDDTALHIFIPEKEDHDNLIEDLQRETIKRAPQQKVKRHHKDMWEEYEENTCLVLCKDANQSVLMIYIDVNNYVGKTLYQYISGTLYAIEIKEEQPSEMPIKEGQGIFSLIPRDIFDEPLVEGVADSALSRINLIKGKKEKEHNNMTDILTIKEETIIDTDKLAVGDVVKVQFNKKTPRKVTNYIVSRVEEDYIMLYNGFGHERVKALDIKSELVEIREIIKNEGEK